MNTKIRNQAPNLVNYIPLPVYQEDAGSSEMMKGLGHKSTETTEKSMRLTPKPTDTVTESLGMPQQPELQVPGFADLTPTLSEQDSNASELTPQKNYQSLETLELLSCLWPQVKDFKQSQTQPATGSKRMTLDLKNHATEMTGLTCKIRQGKEFLRVSSTPINRETECVEKYPRPYPQDLEPVMGSSEKRSPREQSVASSPRPFYHVLDSAPGITPGPQIPESVGLTSKPWLQREKSLELTAQPTNQVVGNTASVELTFEECQTEEVGSGLPTPQKASIEKANVTPIESLDQIINFVTVGPKPLDQMTEPAKTQLQVPQVSKSLTVIPGPPLQVIESVMIPEPTSQGSKYVDLTPKLHDMIVSEFAPRLWLQNVQTKKLIVEPTHQILEMIELSGFQVIKTILLPKPLLLIVRSEELVPGPSLQAVEPIGVATRSRTQVKDPLNLLPRPHLQDKIKPIERTQRANIQENFPELILQQTSPLEEPPVLTHKQRLQAGKSVGIKRESPKVLEMDLNQGQAFQNRDSEMITSEKLQAENYFSRFISSPLIPFISSSVKTSELGPLQGSGMPEVSRARTMKNFNVGILQSPESYTDTIRIQSPALPLVLPSDKTGNSVGSLYPEIWDMDVITKESTEKKQMEEFGNSLQSYSPYPLRLLPSEFQAGLGARRNSIRSFLGRQLNIWESHVCRQRLPRKYLSNMLMLGNVLGTTMERKLCSQPFLTEGATMGICRSIQNLFGVPAELMEFSQSLLERGPRTISQTSVVKNYIQRHILGHGHEKRIPLKMWTRGSTSSIIQQYSGTRLGLKKTNSKLSDVFQEVTQHVPVSCTGAQFPALGKPESPLGILYSREDPVSRELSNISQSDSQTRTSESHHSLKESYFSQTNTELSEQLHLLRDIQLKTAAKLLRSQIPPNVPPPPESGLVLKYPICLQCGQCSGCRCCRKLQSAFGSYLLIYPQIHLIKTPEGHGEIRTHLGFRLHIRKRPQVSKYRGRNRADTSKNPSSSSHRKAKIYTPASKSPTSTRDFQSRSSQSPASVPVHRRQKQWGSHGVAGKTEAKDSGHYEFCEVLSASESGSESNQHEKWAKSRLSKTSDLKYPMKKITKELKKQNIKLYKNSRPTEECPSGTLTDPSRSKGIETTQTSTVSSKRQPKKSSQPRFIQLLFQGLKQAFQRAHRGMAITGQKPEDRASPDNLWSSKNLYPEEKDEDDCLTGGGRGASTRVIKQKFMGSTPKKEDRLKETCDQAQQSKQVSSLQPRPLELANNIVSERNVAIQATSILQPLSRDLNVNKTKKNYEFFSPESKNCSKLPLPAQPLPAPSAIKNYLGGE
ncbi:spermatogenesis-associated protein 31H1-like [Microtus pennsylvanicus]|uniref:spermatogenesis-associated protein 31H1-like n=1 Tax=Microtus pennsylvanicus TaxID=10058 RepID=UPI003F6BB3CE